MIYLTTDDFCPKFMDSWKYWEELKKVHPNLRITAFVVPRHDNKDEYDCSKSKEFKQWFEKNKDWVEVAVHGFDHSKFECLLSYDEQLERFKKALEIMKPFLPKKWGFKPPYYRYNSDTLEIILDTLKAAYFVTPRRIYYGRGKSFKLNNLIETHTNNYTKMGDRIDKVVNDLKKIKPFLSIGDVIDDE